MHMNPKSQAVSRRSFLRAGALSGGLLCLPRSLFAAEESTDDVVFRFAVMSDIHFKANPECLEVGRFRRAVKSAYDYSATQKHSTLDALVIVGDMSDNGIIEQIGMFRRELDAAVREGTETVICMGNHEFYGGNRALWEKTFDRPSNRRYEVNGFQFVAYSPGGGGAEGNGYLYALDWFKKELQTAYDADPDKPVFVLQHYPVTPTVYGGRDPDNWGLPDLYETLQKYPRVIDFSGHTHYPTNDPRCAWQGQFTAFGTGTLSYVEMGRERKRYTNFPRYYRDGAQYLIVEVHSDNSVVVKPYDVRTDGFFNVVYVVPKPGAVDQYTYTDARFAESVPPTWDGDVKIEVEDLAPNAATLVFPQAKSPALTHSYRIELERKANDAWVAFDTFYVWSEYYLRDQPEIMRAELGYLEDNSTYRAKIFPVNCFLREGEPLPTFEFSTPLDPEETVDKDAVKPEANMLDVTFDKNGPKNAPTNGLETQKKVEVNGAPRFEENYATFDGIDDYCKVKFNSSDYAKLRRGTFAVRFKIDAFPANVFDVFCNTEMAGVAYEINGREKTLEFWASIGGSYRTVSAPIEAGKWIDAFATYDGDSIVFYLNGKEVARNAVKGALSHPTNPEVQGFCVGSDINERGVGSAFFAGSIERARIFTWPLTAEQVANLSK